MLKWKWGENRLNAPFVKAIRARLKKAVESCTQGGGNDLSAVLRRPPVLKSLPATGSGGKVMGGGVSNGKFHALQRLWRCQLELLAQPEPPTPISDRLVPTPYETPFMQFPSILELWELQKIIFDIIYNRQRQKRQLLVFYLFLRKNKMLQEEHLKDHPETNVNLFYGERYPESRPA